LVMCPDRKLRWFKDHGRTIQQVNQLKSRVIAFWEKSYKQFSIAAPEPARTTTKPRSQYATSTTEDATRYGLDHIRTYLEESPIPMQTIKEAGGYMKYWFQAQ
ncbi:hypothetical protein CPB83DRAFT_741651, partial [Crepidotus variabilis]